MPNSTTRNNVLFLFLLFVIVGADSWLLQSTFASVVNQQNAVKTAYDDIDRIGNLTVKLRDTELSCRRYLLAGTSDQLALSKQFDELIEDATLAEEDFGKESAEKELIKQFATMTSSQRDGILNQKNSLRTNAQERILESDEVYLKLGSMLSRIKEIELSKLRLKSEPVNQSKSIFYLASMIIALLNLLLGLFAYRLLVQTRKRSEADRLIAEENADESRIESQAALIVGGQISIQELLLKIRELLITEFSAIDTKLFIVTEGKLNSVDRLSSQQGAERIANLTLAVNALRLKKPSVVSIIPQSYWFVGSAFGTSSPNSLIFSPLIFENETVGLLEIATFQPFSPLQIRRLEKISSIFSVSLHANLAREQSETLLKKTLEQSEILQSQQEELRTSNEELEQQAAALEAQQQELGERNRELEKIRNELSSKASDLEKSSRYKTDFLAKMSHELRTPLNSLLILSTLLHENKEKNLTVQQIHFAKSMYMAGNDLLSLINDILDLSKLEASKLVLHSSEFSVGDVFASKKRTFEPMTNHKGIDLIFDMEHDLSNLVLTTDRQRLDQILRNLISNAVKFTEKGSVILSAKFEPSTAFISFTVTDTGAGISESKQKLIFEAFEQSDSSISSRFGGTGLGLSISKELATLLGGTISLTSELNVGSSFELSIPIIAPITGDNHTDSSATSNTEYSNGENLMPISPASPAPEDISQALQSISNLKSSSKSILIVEDDNNFRSVVASSVRDYGFEAVEASDGLMALKLLEKFTPDAILLDIKLPGISGLGILEILKRSPTLRHVPVHMISGLQYQTNALRMGAFGYLSKPVTVEKIRSALERIENLLSKNLRRLLLIEDNALQSEAVSLLIASSEVEVITAKSGREGLRLVENGKFDCIVLDLTLPDVSGFDFLKELRKLAISLPPIVIYTGKELTKDEYSYLEEHSESIVIKGARSPERLLDEVSLFLHRVENKNQTGPRNLISISDSNEQPFSGRTVLVVDDDIRNIFALTSALESKGFTVETARDGIEALESLENCAAIEVVLMDVMMPRMDGLEAIRRIRKNKDSRIRRVPVVVLTAKAMSENHEICMEAGANDYLPKPIVMENLLTVLRVWLPVTNN